MSAAIAGDGLYGDDHPCSICRPRGVSFFHAGAAVNRRWTLILEALTEKGVLRFTRLSELVEGVSQKMLTPDRPPRGARRPNCEL